MPANGRLDLIRLLKVKNMWTLNSTQSILLRGLQRNTSYFVSFRYYYSNRDSSVGTVSGKTGSKNEELCFDSQQGHEVFLLPKVSVPALGTGTYLILPGESFLHWQIV